MLTLLLALACTAPDPLPPDETNDTDDTDFIPETDETDADSDTDEPDDRPTEPFSPAEGIWVDISAPAWNIVRAEALLCFSFRTDLDDTWAIHAHGMDSGVSHKLAWGFVVPENLLEGGNVMSAGDTFGSDVYVAVARGILRIGLFDGSFETVYRPTTSIQHTGGQIVLAGGTAFRSWEQVSDTTDLGRNIPGGGRVDAAAGDDGALYRYDDDGVLDRVALSDGARIDRWTVPSAISDRHVLALDVVGDQAVAWVQDITFQTSFARFTLGDDTISELHPFGDYDPDVSAGCTAERF